MPTYHNGSLCCVYSLWIKKTRGSWFDVQMFSFSTCLHFQLSWKGMEELRSPPLGRAALTLFDPVSGDRNKDVIYLCPSSSYALSLAHTPLVINQSSGHGQAVVKLSPPALPCERTSWQGWTLIIPSSSSAPSFHFPALSRRLPSPPNVTVLRLRESKGQLLVTQRDEGWRGWIASHQSLLLWFLLSDREKAG